MFENLSLNACCVMGVVRVVVKKEKHHAAPVPLPPPHTTRANKHAENTTSYNSFPCVAQLSVMLATRLRDLYIGCVKEKQQYEKRRVWYAH